MRVDKFLGVNNVRHPKVLAPGDLVIADNVDIGMDGEITKRAKLVKISDGEFRCLKEKADHLLAIRGGDLVKVSLTGAVDSILKYGVGTQRMWYCDFPNGETYFSNGVINGVTDGITTRIVGSPIPDANCSFTSVPGQLPRADISIALTHTRSVDGLESGPAFLPPFFAADGGVRIVDIPVVPGFSTNIYVLLGEQYYLAGNTYGSEFTLSASLGDELEMLKTSGFSPMPAGEKAVLWRGRLLTAVGEVLWASITYQLEQCLITRDYKFLDAPITDIFGTASGVWVGTSAGLVFLEGTEFDNLRYKYVLDGYVAKGSFANITGPVSRLLGIDVANGDWAAGVVNGDIVLLSPTGEARNITQGRYRIADCTDGYGICRINNGIPQYLLLKNG